MSKTGRNDPCPCGSAKKYKRCCMAQDQAKEQLALAAKGAQLQAQAAQHSARLGDVKAALFQGLQDLQEPDELDNDSNAVIDLIKQRIKGQQASALMVTHDHRIFSVADRVVHMIDGQIAGQSFGFP